MDKIVFVAFIVSALITYFRSAKEAFIYVYIPLVLLIPSKFIVELPSIPDLGFAQMAIIPIFLGFIMNRTQKWSRSFHFGLIECLVLTYVIFCAYSEYINTANSEGPNRTLWQNLTANMILSILLPYYLGKHLIYPSRMVVPFAKLYVLLIMLLLFISIYEWRFVINPFIVYLGKLFPNQTIKFLPTFRFNMVRITGPFTHAILFGSAVSFAVLFNLWLSRNRMWRRNFSFLPPLFISKGNLITLLLFAGLFFTLSRGPLYSTLLGLIFVGLGYARYRKLSLVFRILLVGLAGVAVLQLINYYKGIDPSLSGSQLNQSAAYRLELFNQYLPVVREKLWFGWGMRTWPQLDGYKSVDNHYLWLTLKHGIIPTAITVAIMVIISLRLFFRGMSLKCKSTKQKSLAFTLFAFYLVLGASSVTVFMGGQIEQIFFIFSGIAVGFLESKPDQEDELLFVTKTAPKMVPAT